MSNCTKLTIIFDPPFYRGIFESNYGKNYTVAMINLGTSDPKIQDIYSFILKHWDEIKFSKEVIFDRKFKKINVKKMQKKARQEKKRTHKFNGTKAQVLLSQQYKNNKKEKKVMVRQHTNAEKERLYRKKQYEKREKRKGH